MADGDRFDPRFDPAFQRGFEGQAEPVPRVAATAPPARPAVEQPGDVVERAVDRVPERERIERSERSRRAAAEPDEDAVGSRRNPFLIAALVIAGLLVVGGVLIFVRLPEWQAEVQGNAVVDYATLQSLYVAAPLMIALGIATVIAVLLQQAVRWRPTAAD